MQIKGAVFDLDGILVDTEYFQWQGWVEPLGKLGVSLSRDVYCERYAGKTGRVIEEELIRDYGLEAEKGSLLEEKERLLMKWFLEKELRAMPYAREAFQFFIDRKIKIAAATGAPRDEALLKLRRTGLDLFGVVVSRNDVARSKPHPETYLKTAELLQLQPQQCMAFEDTQYGVQSAKDAGMVCCAVPNEFSRQQDFSMADEVANNLRESVKWAAEEYKL